MYAIETKKLTKYYGDARGIIDVDLTVNEGEIFGFIGPNGAGKSTTIRTLLSLIYKTSGEAKIFGLDSEKDKIKILENVGYLPSEVYYYDNMKAIDVFKYSESFYHKDCSEKIKMLAERLNLDLDKKVEDMSLGNKKKVGIIQGLLHSPKLIILDEPTSGLDPLIQKQFFELIKEENKNGATILFSSHILSEVQRICDRVAIIKEGRIIKTQKISELKSDSYKKISISCDAKDDLFLKDIEGVANYQINDGVINFIFKGDCSLIIKRLATYNIFDIEITNPSLEEIFMHFYGE